MYITTGTAGDCGLDRERVEATCCSSNNCVAWRKHCLTGAMMYPTTGACVDGELDRERTEATCCSRNMYGIGHRLWRQVFQYSTLTRNIRRATLCTLMYTTTGVSYTAGAGAMYRTTNAGATTTGVSYTACAGAMYTTTGAGEDNEHDRERSEATSCCNNRCGIGRRRWRPVYQ